MKQKILITGGAGFIGSHVVRQFLARGFEVVVLDDLSTGTRENLSEVADQCELVVGSIVDDAAIERSMAGCDGVVHMAVSCLRKSINDPMHSERVNSEGTLRVLEMARKKSVRRFIYISSSEIFGTAMAESIDENHVKKPCTIYASSKLAGENYALNYANVYGLNATVVRPFNNFGPRAHFEKESGEFIPRSMVRLLNGLPPLIYGSGRQTRDMMYAEDTANAIHLAYMHNDTRGRDFNVGTGREISILEMGNFLCDEINPSIRPKMSGVDRPGDVMRHRCNNAAFSEMHGWKPKWSFEAGVREYISWFKERYAGRESSLVRDVAEVNW